VGLTDRIGIGVLTRLPPRDLVDEVLDETGRREQRRRLLPARVVVYYVLALCLFFGDAYEEVMRKLVDGLEFLRCWHGDWDIPTPSALCQARQRLGEAPLKALFEQVAVPNRTRWPGLVPVLAGDGHRRGGARCARLAGECRGVRQVAQRHRGQPVPAGAGRGTGRVREPRHRRGPDRAVPHR
jgi:hypothetical protein